ncbi:MAG: MMPL family transporter [Spirochaetaceae bacterium]|jgi:predicted exporter|nr:MMPL family transporter [Spirochaetaceae bacterium]
MKLPSFPFKGDSPLFSGVWLLLHVGIALALVLSLVLSGPVGINTDLFGLLPGSASQRSVAAADKVLGARTGRGVYILVGSGNFAEAKDAAGRLYGDLVDSPVFESIALYMDDTLLAQVSGYFDRYRYVLLDRETRELLENGGAGQVADEALATAFGSFTLTSLDTIDRDPFLLADREMKAFLSSALLSSGALSLRDEVLTARSGDTWYVLIRGSLSIEGTALTNAESGVERIYTAAAAIREQSPTVEFVYSGVPFHSYASSSGAEREISLISTITSLIILLLFIAVFRSFLPVAITLLSIGVSILTATGAVLLCFREIHLLTFVFGTTLIGMGVDYSVHYFIHRRGNPALETGRLIRSHIRRSITMSLVSSEICFTLLLLAPFTILKQFAVFSITGLFSSFLSVFCLYPLLKNPPPEKRFVFRFLRVPGIKKTFLPRNRLRVFLLTGITLTVLVLLFINRDRLRVENNIGGLYTMPEYLAKSEKTAASVLTYGSAPWYFIVSGENPEEVLEHEETLIAALAAEIAEGNLASYIATSLFIPSLKTQRQNYTAAAALLPWAERQFEYLGFPPEAAFGFREDFFRARDQCVSPGGDLLPYLADIIANLWIGPVDGRYYSCVLPQHTKNEDRFRAIAAELDFVFLVNKVEDIGGELNSLTRTMLLLFTAAFFVMVLVIRFFYSPQDTARICAAAVLVVLTTFSGLAAADISLSFFSVTGLMLVFGLGLDYMFYMQEDHGADSRVDPSGPSSPGRSGRLLTTLAVFLSFGTTALSFGALSLSSFAPVHIFGLTVFIGLSAAFIFAMLLSGDFSWENHRTTGSAHLLNPGSADGPAPNPSRSRHTAKE